MIEHAIRSLLLNSEDIENLVGERIYYMQAIQETNIPYITIQKVSGLRVYSHDGDSSLAHPRIQITVFAETYLEVKQIVEFIQLALSGFRGVSEGIYIQMCLCVSEVDLEAQSGFYGVAVDYTIFHQDDLQKEES